ncbi:hypothetical protein ABE057_07565 [Bacillus paralicheniformis]|uniref:hypothetical protein n=1 Tax=Bacillus paralicheniformis TaxID=1648923 RepID=UPI0035F5E0C3
MIHLEEEIYGQFALASSILREVKTLNLTLAVALVISVFLNIFQLAQLKSNNRKNVKWNESTTRSNPFTAILWTYFAIIILLMLAALVTVIIQLNE